MPNIVLAKPNEKYWISYVKQRIKKNKNFLGFISGSTGSGKSWSSLSISESLDPDFTIDQCVFGGLELMNLLNSGKLKTGSAIVFEEVGVEMSNKNWASTTNKMINYLLQTFRHRRFILIMNSPYMDFVDSSTRKLFHAEMRTLSINTRKKECMLKPQLIQYNSRMQKFYYKRLKVIKPEGVIPVDVWNVPKPSDDLVKAYEEKKREYTDNLNKKIYQELQAVENKGKRKTELTDIQKDTLEKLERKMSIEQIGITQDRNVRGVKETIRLIRNKGYKLLPQQNKGVPVWYKVIEPNNS